MKQTTADTLKAEATRALLKRYEDIDPMKRECCPSARAHYRKYQQTEVTVYPQQTRMSELTCSSCGTPFGLNRMVWTDEGWLEFDLIDMDEGGGQ